MPRAPRTDTLWPITAPCTCAQEHWAAADERAHRSSRERSTPVVGWALRDSEMRGPNSLRMRDTTAQPLVTCLSEKGSQCAHQP